MRTAESVTFTCWPPFPLARKVSIRKIALLDLDLDLVVEVREGGHRGERRVAAVLGIEGGHPDQAVDSRLDAQPAVGVIALDLERGALDARFPPRAGGPGVRSRTPRPLAQRMYMPRSISAQSWASVPPAPGLMVTIASLGIVFAGEQPPEFELVELALETVEVLTEVLRHVLTLADPLRQRLDLVHRPLEGGAPLQLGEHARPAPGQRLAVARSRPDRRIAQALVELGDLLAQAIPVKETPGPRRRDRTNPRNGRAVPDS